MLEDILALVLIFGGGTCAALAFSPVGRAVADRIRGRVAGAEDAAAHRTELAESLDDLRREVAELAERVDFTERMLAQARDADRVGPGDVAR